MANNFKKLLLKFRMQCSHTIKNSYLCKMLFDYKLYVALIILVIFLLFVLPVKIWAMVFLGIISYVTAIIDDSTNMTYPIQTGPAFALVLAAYRLDFIFLLLFYVMAVLLPHIQMQRLFEPINMMTYLWLAIVMKVVKMIPLQIVANALIGLLLFQLGVFVIQKLNNRSGRAVWALFKNAFLILIVLGSPLAGIFAS